MPNKDLQRSGHSLRLPNNTDVSWRESAKSIPPNPHYTIEAGGHTILHYDNEFECADCTASIEIPMIIEESGGRVELVYRAYAIGSIVSQECETTTEELLEELFEDDNDVSRVTTPYDPSRVHWTYDARGDNLKLYDNASGQELAEMSRTATGRMKVTNINTPDLNEKQVEELATKIKGAAGNLNGNRRF